MAVYTIVDTQDLQNLLKQYDIGQLISCKGIAEGVENSNYFVETDQNKFVMTLYENRTNKAELPFFFDLLDHLHQAGCPVPKFIADKQGQILQNIAGKPACIIEFLPGISITKPNIETARSMGTILAEMHIALKNYTGNRDNNMSLTAWHKMLNSCKIEDVKKINDKLYDRISIELDFLDQHWPKHLPQSVIHGDLFPDNVLLMGNKISGLIDFYFAATDIKDYDIAVTHAAWCFSTDGKIFNQDISDAFLTSYDNIYPMDHNCKEYFPILFRGAAIRFIISRTVDWINTPQDALVNKKDPVDFLNRLDFYSNDTNINHILNFKD